MAIQAYGLRRDDPTSRRFGTFSYLPPMTDAQIRKQVEYMISQGWACSIEHVEPPRAMDTYWYLWKLPLFGETDPDAVIAEATACRAANPGDHVRITGYNGRRQTQGLSVVVHRGSVG
jgi:ribulose-bisphosphate carboxylase small chain